MTTRINLKALASLPRPLEQYDSPDLYHNAVEGKAGPVVSGARHHGTTKGVVCESVYRLRKHAFDENTALTDIKALSAPDMQGRAPGTPGHVKAQQYIVQAMKQRCNLTPVPRYVPKDSKQAPAPAGSASSGGAAAAAPAVAAVAAAAGDEYKHPFDDKHVNLLGYHKGTSDSKV
jgi:hypothetical protein